jgi:hypothetical protein
MSSGGTPSGRKVVLTVVVGLVFASVGGFLLYSQEQAIRNATAIEGTVESSSVDEETTRRDRDDDGVREEETSYYARVTYTYEYDGERYTGDNVFPGAGSPSVSEGEARDVVERYPEGETATVYVDPEDPNDAFLVHERSLLAPGAFLAMGGLVLLGGLNWVRKLVM